MASGSLRPPIPLAVHAPKQEPCGACARPAPPPGGLLDRLAELFEQEGPNASAREMLRLEHVLSAAEVSQLSPKILRFYAEPEAFRVRASIQGNRWSLLLLWAFAVFARQSLVPGRERDPEPYPVAQWLYTDRKQKVHWDRYACVNGRCKRLFVARMDGFPQHVRETFIVYGLPVALTFAASVVHGGLLLQMKRRLSSPFAWIAEVQYHTEDWNDGLRTRGDFRVPVFGMRVQTEFLIESR